MGPGLKQESGTQFAVFKYLRVSCVWQKTETHLYGTVNWVKATKPPSISLWKTYWQLSQLPKLQKSASDTGMYCFHHCLSWFSAEAQTRGSSSEGAKLLCPDFPREVSFPTRNPVQVCRWLCCGQWWWRLGWGQTDWWRQGLHRFGEGVPHQRLPSPISNSIHLSVAQRDSDHDGSSAQLWCSRCIQATSVEEDCSNPEWDLEHRDFQK